MTTHLNISLVNCDFRMYKKTRLLKIWFYWRLLIICRFVAALIALTTRCLWCWSFFEALKLQIFCRYNPEDASKDSRSSDCLFFFNIANSDGCWGARSAVQGASAEPGEQTWTCDSRQTHTVMETVSYLHRVGANLLHFNHHRFASLH